MRVVCSARGGVSLPHLQQHSFTPLTTLTPLTSGMAKAKKKEKESGENEAKVNIEYVLSPFAVLIG